jgi:hypothetical protein
MDLPPPNASLSTTRNSIRELTPTFPSVWEAATIVRIRGNLRKPSTSPSAVATPAVATWPVATAPSASSPTPSTSALGTPSARATAMNPCPTEITRPADEPRQNRSTTFGWHALRYEGRGGSTSQPFAACNYCAMPIPTDPLRQASDRARLRPVAAIRCPTERRRACPPTSVLPQPKCASHDATASRTARGGACGGGRVRLTLTQGAP